MTWIQKVDLSRCLFLNTQLQVMIDCHMLEGRTIRVLLLYSSWLSFRGLEKSLPHFGNQFVMWRERFIHQRAFLQFSHPWEKCWVLFWVNNCTPASSKARWLQACEPTTISRNPKVSFPPLEGNFVEKSFSMPSSNALSSWLNCLMAFSCSLPLDKIIAYELGII